MELVDTHAHLDWRSFKDDLPQVIANACNAGVTRVITVGASLERSRKAIEIARTYTGVYAAVGIHPNDLSAIADRDWDALAELAGLPEVVAVGETGLDFYRDGSPRELQSRYFLKHLDLARAAGKPAVLHIRDAAQDALKLLEGRAGDGVSLVWHCFSGNARDAARAVALGMSFSVGGSLTYRGNDDLRKAVAGIPPDRLMLETDCPFLTPEPHRNTVRRNEPALVVHVLGVLARLMGMSEEDAATVTTANAGRVFKLA
ncbi:MAG TPA: TatD family hydrolase [Candidatus Brocadiia bacterium]|nr:TatD family hydrolase [Candidatus Brocadiia bacterium]